MAYDNSDQTESGSPEVSILPYESLNDRQKTISGECLPEHYIVMCESCYWCCTCFNSRGFVTHCPLCYKDTSKIPLTIEESCKITIDAIHGLTMRFDRKLPLR
jgi:hypothetical protein